MYAVIFKAKTGKLDSNYAHMAKRMRQLAIDKYGCCDFISTTEGNLEIAISYWHDLKQIKKWKQDPEHLTAQDLGKSTWYKSYTVQVVEIIREYRT
ncbi:MAG: antibiotic biosynthesis monooxygenase [Gammaproteobacteria bacterium]|nr:antibiotic biosynthesis monooxygenase [Gammaproteobacteria bacterium]